MVRPLASESRRSKTATRVHQPGLASATGIGIALSVASCCVIRVLCTPTLHGRRSVTRGRFGRCDPSHVGGAHLDRSGPPSNDLSMDQNSSRPALTPDERRIAAWAEVREALELQLA